MALTFSANLGFLWTELPLADAIRAAAAAGFDAVECHWPYDEPLHEVRAALQDTGLRMMSLNTRRGEDGQFGLSALPGREREARALIDEALDTAVALEVPMVHVMAGKVRSRKARDTFRDALRYACTRAAPHGITILIEALNAHDAPGYFLGTTEEARRVLESVDLPNLRLMFDCYHVQRSEGDVLRRLEALLPIVGHIQFAGAPDRGWPDRGELHYPYLFDRIAALGWARPLGAEYRPDGPTEDSLGWLRAARSTSVI